MIAKPGPVRPPSSPNLRRGPGAFSRQLDIHDVKAEPLAIAIEANAEERAAVAAEAGVPAVAALSARFTVHSRAGGRFEVEGDLAATITEICVVSLEPFDCAIEQEIAVVFAPVAAGLAPTAPRGRDRRALSEVPPVRPATVPGSDDQEDPPDPIVDDRIDLGAVAVEFLTLGRDLYPKKPDVHFNDVVSGEKDDQEPSALAAALERLKDRS